MNKFYKVKGKVTKKLWEKVKDDYEGLRGDYKVKFQKKSDDSYDAIFSTASEDRDGDVIKQNFELDSFKRNPVLIDSHRYDSIDRIIGKIENISISDGKLKGTLKFALDNPRGVLASKLAEKGFLSATSIGFIPKEFNDKGEIEKSELLEVSLVGVPSNPEALLEKQKKQKGVDNQEDEENEADDELEGSEKETEEESEEKETKKPRKSKKELAKEAIKELADRRYKILKSLRDVANEYKSKIKDKNISKKEKRLLNKSIRDLIKAKKRG